jgi:hypothetical protein
MKNKKKNKKSATRICKAHTPQHTAPTIQLTTELSLTLLSLRTP